MIKKQSIVALVLLLLIPPVSVVGGLLFSLINPEMAAGHPNYVENYHRLVLLRNMCFFGSVAVGGGLWILVCLLAIRSKKRSPLWLLLSVLGPLGFSILGMLNDRAPGEKDPYDRFVRKLNWFVRAAYELASFVLIWGIAYQTMVAKRMLMIGIQSIATGVSSAQILDLQNASSGMWAFGDGVVVMYLVVLFYLLRPMVFSGLGEVAVKLGLPRAG